MEFVVVGCRGFGRYHLDALSGMDVDVSIVESDSEAVRECTGEYGISKVYSSFDEALRSGAEIIDLVVPHHLHHPMAMKAIESGKHVLVEKPIATTEEDAMAMARAAEKASRKFMVAEQYFFDPAIARINDAIRKDEIGRVHTIIVRSQRMHLETGWRQDPAKMGGGPLIDEGIHYLDAMLNIGGEYEGISSRSYRGEKARTADDTTMAIFDFSSGAHGLFFHSCAYNARINTPAYEIIGDDGGIVEDAGTRPDGNFRAMRGKRALGDPVVNNRILQIGEYDVFEAEIRGFIESVENDADVPFSPDLALRDLRAVLAIYGR